MAATELHITIEQGADFSLALTVPVALNGFVPRGTLRDAFGGNLLATFSFTTVATGVSTMSLTAAQTAALTAPPSAGPRQRRPLIGYYDVEVPGAASAVTRTHQGDAYLSREVSS